MKFDFVFLLPLLAFALGILYPFFEKVPDYAKSIKSRAYRKRLLGRLTVIVMPIATLAAFVLPLTEFNNLYSALLYSAIVIVPVFLIHFYMTLHHGNRRLDEPDLSFFVAEKTNEVDNRHTDFETTEKVKRKQSSQLVHANTAMPEAENLRVINLTNASYSTGINSETSTSAPSLFIKERATTEIDAAHSADDVDSPAEIQEQLDRVSDLVDSHDLGDSDYSLSEDDMEITRFPLITDVSSPIDSTLTIVDMSSAQISKMSSNEISELVTTLHRDKARLQKLVIAQHASINTERKAHDHSRVVARDAIKIMRDARNGQKFAEKIARRERSERIRVVQEYKKVSSALDNAMSIIKSRKA
ncbi:MAG: hypothetical protein ACJA0Z_004785 [Halioglobus sp.]|jgi:hypothetical protein